MSSRDKVQLNVSIDAAMADSARQMSTREGRKLGETVERMIRVYSGQPGALLERLQRLKKKDLNAKDRADLRELQDLVAYLLYAES